MLAYTTGIYFIQQAFRSDTIILYNPSIFDRASIISNTTKLLLAIALDVVKINCTLLAAFLLDRIGRRPLLLTSIGGMIISLASLGTCLTVIYQSQGVVKWAPTICFLLLVCYVASFSIGMGPIASIYSSEVFPLRLRVRGCAIGVAMSQLARCLISFGFVFYFQHKVEPQFSQKYFMTY
ncbi:hypothetical protein ACJRO7_026935 [Eucalyptus globulus]|uniref:Major facilitator superfamily (MFS) profile domain-containing protein n=1 Tax=Eucalyptus globulus TaxID=34317 RepID=A0ABD3JZU2_EUCGL